MSDFIEEQMLEVEALEAIYIDEFSKICDSPLEWKVSVFPNPDGEGENHVGVELACVITPSYPDELPDIRINVIKGLTSAQSSEILSLARKVADENIGTVMGYTIVEAIRIWLSANNVGEKDGSMHATMLRRMDERSKQDRKDAEQKSILTAEDDEEILRKKRLAEGTAVNAATFAAWSISFEKEQAQFKQEDTVLAHSQLTGKQMFLQHLVKEEDMEEGNEDEDYDLLQGEDESLFLQGEDEDDEFLDLSDEEQKSER